VCEVLGIWPSVERLSNAKAFMASKEESVGKETFGSVRKTGSDRGAIK
jgi:hypothetical protein